MATAACAFWRQQEHWWQDRAVLPRAGRVTLPRVTRPQAWRQHAILRCCFNVNLVPPSTCLAPYSSQKCLLLSLGVAPAWPSCPVARRGWRHQEGPGRIKQTPRPREGGDGSKVTQFLNHPSLSTGD